MTPFGKHPALIIQSKDPYNAGPPLELLLRAPVTPQQLFFVRNHGSVPDVDPTHYRLAVTGMMKRSLELSLDEIRNGFSKSTVMATLQCAGNRRQELMAVAPIPGEVPWGAEAISNAVWSGVSLREILLTAEVETEARHVVFTGLDQVKKGSQTFGFGGSIPIEKARGTEVLLAYEMNGEPLAPVHGFPLRVVVPGYIGARSVKWLANITVQREPSDNYFQAHAYKLFPPYIQAETANWAQGLMLGELSVNAVICKPFEGEMVAERVDISSDGGETWVVVELAKKSHPWAWSFWEARLDLKLTCPKR